MAKDNCSYHSTSPSVWHCDECFKDFCDKCIVVVREPGPPPRPRCPLCENWLTYLGAANSAKAFWTVAPMFFTYPFRGSGGALLVLASILGFLIGAGFFSLPLFIFLCAVIVRYGVAVIAHVAQGHSGVPSLNEAIQSDEDHIFFKFVALLIGLVALEIVVHMLVGQTAGTVGSIAIAIVFPAMVIFLAVERHLGSALLPNRLVWLIGRIGWPYALVVFLSNVLSTGPVLVIAAAGDDVSGSLLVPLLAFSMAYFGVVNFAMLGYVIYEKQGELGYVAGGAEDVEVSDSPANRLQRLLGEVNVLIKEGRQADTLKLVDRARAEFSDDPMFFERAVLLAVSARDPDLIESLTNGYLRILMQRDAVDPALECCRKSMAAHKGYRPASPDIAHALAERAYSKNLNKEALTLLVNLHKRAPQYARLGEAYRLAAKIFRDSLGDNVKADQLEAFVAAKGYA